MENPDIPATNRLGVLVVLSVVVAVCLVFAIQRFVAWSAVASDEAREEARINRILGR